MQARPDSAQIRQPDLTVWFDLPPAVAAQRLAAARVPDRFESQPQAFFERVAAGYAQRMSGSPGRFARIASDLPEADRPSVQVLDTASPRFQALVAETRAARGADFSVCDITLPVQVAAPAV